MSSHSTRMGFRVKTGWRMRTDHMVKDYTIHCYRPGAGISTAEMNIPFV